MRTWLLTASLVLGLAAGGTRADPYTPYFDAVRVKVVALRDAIGEPETKQEAKRKAALEKILDGLDKVSVSLATDLATGKALAATVVKGFLDDPELPDVALEVLTSLEGDVKARAQALTSRLAALPDSKATRKAQRLVKKVNAPLTSADAAAAALDLKKLAGALLKAGSGAEALDKALTRIETSSGIQCAGPRGSATATLDGAPYDVDPYRIVAKVRRAAPTSTYDPKVLSVRVEFYRVTASPQGPFVDPQFAFAISQDSPAGQFHGAGTYAVGRHSDAAVTGSIRVPGQNELLSVSGTLTLSEFSLETERIVGTVDFVGEDSLTPPSRTVSATFAVTCIEFIDPD